MSRPRTRGFWGTFAVIGSVSAVLFGVLWTLLYSFTRETELGELIKLGAMAGLLFGLLFGFVMALLMQGYNTSMNFTDRAHFLERLTLNLSAMGYKVGAEQNGHVMFKPTWRAGILAGRITVDIGEGVATVSGPQAYVKRLQRRLQSA